MSLLYSGFRLVIPILTALLVVVMCGHAKADTKTLAGLKAAYIYNIAKFTHWPGVESDEFGSSINFCLYGANDVTSELNKMDGFSIGARPVQVVIPEQEADFYNCHLLYISPAERRRYRYLLSLVQFHDVLTISDDDRFIRSGGIINLTELQKRLRFEVNQKILSEQKFTISSKLLKLAIMVGE